MCEHVVLKENVALIPEIYVQVVLAEGYNLSRLEILHWYSPSEGTLHARSIIKVKKLPLLMQRMYVPYRHMFSQLRVTSILSILTIVRSEAT